MSWLKKYTVCTVGDMTPEPEVASPGEDVPVYLAADVLAVLKSAQGYTPDNNGYMDEYTDGDWISRADLLARLEETP